MKISIINRVKWSSSELLIQEIFTTTGETHSFKPKTYQSIKRGEDMQKPYVYITRKIPEEALSLLTPFAEIGMWTEEDQPVPRDVLLKESSRAQALVTMLTEKIDPLLLDAAKELKVVANVAVGYDNIDIEAAKERNVVVTNTPNVLTDTTADLTFALLMAVARRITEAVEYIKQDQWKSWSPMQLVGADIHHKTIGIVGMGRSRIVLCSACHAPKFVEI